MTTSSEQERIDVLPDSAIQIRLPDKTESFNVHHELDVRRAVEQLVGALSMVEEVYLFGSRRYTTGSVRSDIDLLLVGDKLPPNNVVASVARGIDPYLDVFLAQFGVAHSAINNSVISAISLDALLEKLDPVRLWSHNGLWDPAADAFQTVSVLAGFTPPYTIAAPLGPEPLVKRVDVMFISALSEEYSAVVSRFDRHLSNPPSNERHHYELGEIDTAHGARIVCGIVTDRAGPIPAAITTYRGIELFRPKVVVLVGITAGIKDEVNLGDLIVPDTIVEYEATKVSPSGEKSHGRTHASDAQRIAAIQAWPGREGWLQRISPLSPASVALASGVHLSTDAMASGSKVIGSAERATAIANLQRKTVAIEMEAIGVVEACQRATPLVSAVVVKAVSDFADDTKDDSWHKFASMAAADLAITLTRDQVI
jgi:nucleoside phosphorylase